MINSTLICLAVMIFCAMAVGRLAKLIKLPNVTGYLVAGLLIGPSVLNIIPSDFLNNAAVISEVALGFIAFSIGNEFKLSYFKRVGITPIVIAIFESLFAVVFVFVGLLAVGCSLPFALTLSAIAAATAPAATIMVIKQYKAKGPVSETLLSVVAIDDAVALILFGVLVAIATSILHPGASIIKSLISPVIEIFGALLLGFFLGLVFTYALRFFKKDNNRLALTVGFVFIAAGISDLLGVSALLCCMALGAAFANFSSQSDSVMKIADSFSYPIYMLFFTASGAQLNLSVVPTIGIVGIIYVLLRVLGKIFGAWFGAKIKHADRAVCKYLGPALIPQAGVAIGLSLVATSVVPEHGATIRAVILCATLIYELVGPMITKISLSKAGEIENTY